MYLKEIQTLGFKSFADKLNFEFTNNINGIVGPNGSGKSNVVDAIRWVLGEQSNKELRADTSTSVIFSGSKSRKALNSAMVNLIFDNSDRHLGVDFNEVSIKRILYRTGENEYYLNGEKCRLKDISDLLTDSGAAKESFNIIGQGKIDEILSTKPQDKRIIFEEAAGVLKYKKRKEEAIRKLDRTNTNINRINDIISELETNLEPLRKQSEDAKRYNKTKEELTNKEISLLVYDIESYSREYNLCKERITSLTDEISKLRTNNTGYDINLLKLKERLSSLEDSINNKRNELLSKNKELSNIDTELKLFRERIKYIKEDNIDSDTNKLKESILLKRELINNNNRELDILNKKNDILNNELSSLSNKYKELSDEINKLNSMINSNNNKISDYEYKKNYIENSINNGGGIPSSVKNILNNSKYKGICNTIESLIDVDKDASLAVSTSLGGALYYLVVDTQEVASNMVKYLKENHLGRATFYPLDVIKERTVDNQTIELIKNIEGFKDILVNRVRFNNKYKSVIYNQLGNVILANNIDNANKISKIINNRYKIVTIDGQVVNVGGSITGGDKVRTSDTIKLRYDLEEIINNIKVLKDNNIKYTEDINIYNNNFNILGSDINNKKLEIYNNNNLIKDIANNVNNIKIEVNNIESEIKEIDSINSNKSELEEQNLINKYYSIKDDISNIENDINIIKLDYDKVSSDIKEIENLSKNEDNHINKLESDLKNNEIKYSSLEVRIDNALNSLNEDYTITYNEAKEKYIMDGIPDDYRKDITRLKNIIKDIGIVNLGAIEEYDRVSERYNFLSKQKEDLNNAENTLLEIISDMDNIMKDKFLTTFNEIREEFRRVFRELFRGGSADIYMTDPDNILETGIEMEATPPGKNLKNIQSLSGGERTFTAISLLFAILNVRPVPFCVFDEVEAALDDANVDAFGEYLSKYSNKTQFVIITHKKKTMEFINTLYGLTMQESGVSKLVSVKLDDLKQ